MASIKDKSLNIPLKDTVIDSLKIISINWLRFFQDIKKHLDPLGIETIESIDNNVSTAKPFDYLNFNSKLTSQAIVEYLIQRITTSTGATELIESGSFHVAYKPISDNWVMALLHSGFPNNAGVTFSISSDGQVKYTSSNITGTEYISRIVFRTRTISAKHSDYSRFGRA